MKIFLYSSSVYFCYLFLISSASVRSISFLYFIVSIIAWKYSLGISNFPEEISTLPHSIVFLYFLALITEEGFLISPCYWLCDLERLTLISETTFCCLNAAASAAKSLQSCLTLCNPIDGSSPGSPIPQILQARTLEWVAIWIDLWFSWKFTSKSWLVAFWMSYILAMLLRSLV